MKKLDTIQKVGKLNDVYVVDEKGPGNANHQYIVVNKKDIDIDITELNNVIGEITFQKGPRALEESQHGVLDVDLLEICRDRLKGFQSGDFACEENQKALEHIEIALMYLNKRVEDRHFRNVLGTYEK